MHRCQLCWIMFVPEHERENQSKKKCIAGKRKPDAGPVTDAFMGEVIDNNSASVAAHDCSDTIGHKHKQALSACSHI